VAVLNLLAAGLIDECQDLVFEVLIIGSHTADGGVPSGVGGSGKN